MSEYPWSKKNITFTWLISFYSPFKTVLVDLESNIFFVAQPWWATFKISFAVIFVGKTQIIFEKLKQTLPQLHFRIKFLSCPLC